MSKDNLDAAKIAAIANHDEKPLTWRQIKNTHYVIEAMELTKELGLTLDEGIELLKYVINEERKHVKYIPIKVSRELETKHEKLAERWSKAVDFLSTTSKVIANIPPEGSTIADIKKMKEEFYGNLDKFYVGMKSVTKETEELLQGWEQCIANPPNDDEAF